MESFLLEHTKLQNNHTTTILIPKCGRKILEKLKLIYQNI